MLIPRGGYLGVDLYDEIMSTTKVKWNHVWTVTDYGHRESQIQIDDYIGECITLWMNNKNYAGLTLHEFLDRCSDDPGHIQNLRK